MFAAGYAKLRKFEIAVLEIAKIRVRVARMCVMVLFNLFNLTFCIIFVGLEMYFFFTFRGLVV